eukprot:NODE_375_length_8520_cov_0.377390.p3 type:complete len:289 gc:universal NODE_375_length_8520_cov_0.377390:6332-7198(+)
MMIFLQLLLASVPNNPANVQATTFSGISANRDIMDLLNPDMPLDSIKFDAFANNPKLLEALLRTMDSQIRLNSINPDTKRKLIDIRDKFLGDMIFQSMEPKGPDFFNELSKFKHIAKESGLNAALEQYPQFQQEANQIVSSKYKPDPNLTVGENPNFEYQPPTFKDYAKAFAKKFKIPIDWSKIQSSLSDLRKRFKQAKKIPKNTNNQRTDATESNAEGDGQKVDGGTAKKFGSLKSLRLKLDHFKSAVGSKLNGGFQPIEKFKFATEGTTKSSISQLQSHLKIGFEK